MLELAVRNEIRCWSYQPRMRTGAGTTIQESGCVSGIEERCMKIRVTVVRLCTVVPRVSCLKELLCGMPRIEEEVYHK